MAAARIEVEPPRSTSGRGAPASKPPINLDAVDPALATIEMLQHDPTSRVSILEALESWERIIRAENELVPYGVASSAAGATSSSSVLLSRVCLFLRSWLEWLVESVAVDFADFSYHVFASRRVLARWSFDTDPPPRWRVACPSLTDDGPCNASLRFSGLEDNELACPRCGSVWSPARLLAVATDADAGSVWVDAEAAGVAVGVDPSTVRRWARSGKVRRSGQRYSLADLRAAVDTPAGPGA